MIIVGFLRCKIIFSKPEDVHRGTPAHLQATSSTIMMPSCVANCLQPFMGANPWKKIMKTLSWVGTNSLTNSLHVLIITTLGSFRSPAWKPKRNLSRKTCGWGFFRPSKAGISEKNRGVHHRISNPSLVIGESTSWWLNQPIWNILVKLDHFPRVRDENAKYLKPPPRSNILWWIPGAVDDQQQQDHRLGKRRGAWKHHWFFPCWKVPLLVGFFVCGCVFRAFS